MKIVCSATAFQKHMPTLFLSLLRACHLKLLKNLSLVAWLQRCCSNHESTTKWKGSDNKDIGIMELGKRLTFLEQIFGSPTEIKYQEVSYTVVHKTAYKDSAHNIFLLKEIVYCMVGDVLKVDFYMDMGGGGLLELHHTEGFDLNTSWCFAIGMHGNCPFI